MATAPFADGVTMTSGQPGWYPDPSGQNDLRWWNGTRWTDDTRAHPEAPTAPVPIVPASAAPPLDPPTSTTPAAPPSTPPTAPPSSAPPAQPWTPPFTAPGSTATSPTSTIAPSPSPSLSLSPSPAGPPPLDPSSATTPPPFAAYTTPPPTMGGAPADDEGRLNWIAWAGIGTVAAVIIAAVAFMVSGVLASPSSPSATGAGASTTSTAVPGKGSTTTAPGQHTTTSTVTKPTTTIPPPNPTYRDPYGIYMIQTGRTWQRIPNLPGSHTTTWRVQPNAKATFAVTGQSLAFTTSIEQLSESFVIDLEASGAADFQWAQPVTLADGTQAQLLRYTVHSPVTGDLAGEAVLTSNDKSAASIVITALPAAAAQVFAQVDPYMKTLHLL
jgi:hypothetical protein